MPKPKVFVTRLIPEAGLSRVREATDAEVWEEQLPPPKEVILQKVADCEGLLTLLTDPIDAEVISAGPKLKVISNYAVGFDNIDLEAASARGIPVGNTPDVLTETTADMAWALMMSIARRVVEGDRYTCAGHWRTWEPQLLLGTDVYGATLGIVGFGRIGQAVARRARGFGMRVLYHDVAEQEETAAELGADFAELDDLLRRSTFVTLHCALTPETHHLIGARELGLIGPDGYLINTARGPAVDGAALYDALKAGKIAGAALDVTEEEPIPAGSPLLSLDNVIVTPHIASASRATRSRMAEMAAENLLAGLEGRALPHCADPEAPGCVS
jgi:glyoxylate reductase